MFVLSNFIYAVAVILRVSIQLELFCLILSTVLGIFVPASNNRLRLFVDGMSELVLRPLRKTFPGLRRRVFDLTPVVAILMLLFADLFVVSSIFDLSRLLR